MSFWNTFVKVWQVRTSFRIQEAIENSLQRRADNSSLSENIPKIVDELNKKNEIWNKNISIHRDED
jgi:hypothetical protein